MPQQTDDYIAELALIELSRMQREAGVVSTRRPAKDKR